MRQGEPRPGPASGALLGIVLIVLAMSLLSVNDAVTRHLADRYPTMAIIFLRSFPALIAVLVIVHIEGAWRRLATRRPLAQLLRGGLMILSYWLFLQALIGGLHFALAVGLIFTSPFFVAALSPLVLGEKVTMARWIAALIGFAGVMVAVRPGFGSFDWLALYSLGAGFVYACTALLARRLGTTEPAAVTGFYTWLMFLLGSMPFALLRLGEWSMPDLGDWGWLVAIGLISGTAHYFIVSAYRRAPAAVVAPFEYVAIIWAAIFGFAFWQEMPDLPTLAGIALIFAGGLVILYGDRGNKA
jgi:drug/metabolite transporter (DMT)-like permease